jgi:hypothetical protein
MKHNALINVSYLLYVLDFTISTKDEMFCLREVHSTWLETIYERFPHKWKSLFTTNDIHKSTLNGHLPLLQQSLTRMDVDWSHMLMVSIFNQHNELTEFIINNSLVKDYSSVLSACIQRGNLSLIRRFEQMGASILRARHFSMGDIVNPQKLVASNSSILMSALISKSVPMTELIFEAGFDLKTTPDSLDIILLAITKCEFDIANVLLEKYFPFQRTSFFERGIFYEVLDLISKSRSYAFYREGLRLLIRIVDMLYKDNESVDWFNLNEERVRSDLVYRLTLIDVLDHILRTYNCYYFHKQTLNYLGVNAQWLKDTDKELIDRCNQMLKDDKDYTNEPIITKGRQCSIQ